MRLSRAILSAWVVLASSAAAAEAPEWRLLDAEGRPCGGVRVSLLGRSGAVVTDAEGRFTLRPAPRPPFEIAVFDARGTLLGTVRVVSGADGPDLRLRPVAAESVTVLSGAAPSTIAPPAAAATVFSTVEQRERRPDRLVDVLAEVPGTSRVGPGATAVPALRGLARGRTLILLDDARVTAERRAGPSASFLDPFSLESVEIVRGPGSVAYGSDALGGIIHARTPTPRPGATACRWEVAAGVGEPEASAALEVNAPVGRGALLAQAHARSVSDYRSPDGTVEGSSSRDRGLVLRGLLPGVDSPATLGLRLDRARQIERPSADPDAPRTVYPEERSDRLTFGLALPPVGGLDSLELDAFAGRYRLVTDRVEPDPAGLVERSGVDANDASLRLVATRPWSDGVLRAGLDVSSRFDLSARNFELRKTPGGGLAQLVEDVAIESARQVSAGLFVECERPLPSLSASLAAGARGNRVETRNRGGGFGDRSTGNSSPSGYLAIRWHPARAWSSTLQYARGFRDARLSDRYFSGVTGRGRIVGNPDLEPETSDQLDLAVHAGAGRLRLAAYAYLYRIDNLIERFRVAGPGDLFHFTNRGEVELRGLELEADLRLRDGLDLRIAGNLAQGEIRDDGSAPNDVPPESLTLALRGRTPGRSWWRVQASLFARDDEPGSTEKTMPGYVVIDASAGFELAAGIEARVLIGNLLDRRFPDSADENAPVAPGLGVALVLAGRF